ncbi:LPS export ABC transporter periplasmic protein LptC [Basilea psittacipulmonis]|uniref:LPS export ABC transporter periplasmic protein LptC n=1 Tax=Basilea psittacipulmonis DSM 24701 TaxID=1072685 RepID=A0A077DB89_9BURK|nr:LPS export ABC transporter periplasmic protein LptC [Basilea psittacipulmonis]AIL32130.1 hypothetical protein IX83_01245 [Basilea psittacipulmonis DSM 24701]
MKERFSGILAVTFLLVLAVSSWWAADYAARSVEGVPETKNLDAPDAWSGKFTMLSSNEQGVVVNRLVADSMEHYPVTDTWEIVAPHYFAQYPNEAPIEATSDKAIVYNAETPRKIELLGHAHMVRSAYAGEEQLDIDSEKLVVYPDSGIVMTDEPVVATQAGSRLSGNYMTYNNRTRQLNIRRGTNLNISDKDIPKK